MLLAIGYIYIYFSIMLFLTEEEEFIRRTRFRLIAASFESSNLTRILF